MNHKKSSLFLGMMAVLIAACTTTKNTATANTGTNNDTKTSSDITVTLSIEYTSQYCGGANPPDEVIQKLRTPKKYADMEIYISKEAKLNDGLMEVKTDANGNLTTELSSGTYYLYMPEKVSAKLKKSGDASRCEDWKNKPNGQFTVTNESSELAVAIVKSCNSCGALPQ